MKTVLTQKELADRWGVTVKALTDWRNAKVIQSIGGIPAIRFSKEYIENLEGITIEKFSPLERKRMELELEKLKSQNDELKRILGNVLAESSKIISF
ncbi:histidine kinase [Clostridium gasigenes]|uniref:histidine kinase n=1 Tax=Clostridium gasigenes TaxID=94869 RepID=UPI001629DFB5|nr:histidine kinase [Clostridium gasigenes]MBB6622258.1 histidine kinase [Clostridium gasigenes]